MITPHPLTEINAYREKEKKYFFPKGVDRGPGMQSSNNAYMLVYMLNSSIAEIRNHEMKEMTKRDTVRRTTIQGPDL